MPFTGQAANLTIGEVRESLRAASTGLAEAVRGFINQTRPVYSSSVSSTSSVAARLNGLSARMTPVSVSYSVLQTTQKINTQTSTIRSSSSALDLDITSPQSASAITATAEMNTGETTSYGSSTLSFSGPGLASTSSGTLSGTYTGINSAAGATSLVLKITGGATLNTLLATNTKFEVRDQADNLLFSYDGNLKAGDTVYLGNDIGLSVSFSSGRLSQDHTGSTTVSHNPIDVDSNAAFNNANPNLRPKFENDAQVTAGSFTIDGTSITVNANDTINTLLARINASSAGVTASIADEKITLTTNSNSEDDIVLANDTSGFLSAAKLASATTTRGNIRDDQQVLSKTTQFTSIASGSFAVNGVSISVNKDTDTLTSVISRINSAGVGVTASYDISAGKLVLTPNAAGSALALESDTSGFLQAAQVSTGTMGTHVNVCAAFNGTGLNSPLFDPGMTVQSGSFTVNGVTITVAADDTIDTVLGKITASDAEVTATYDDSSQTVALTSKQEAAPAITVGNDTSGFLAAVKFNGTAESTTGEQSTSQFDTTFDRMVEYSGVHAGTVSVNGEQIPIDPATTTIRELVSVLDGIADVSATLDETTGTVTISSERLGAGLNLSDTSGVLSSLGIADGIYNGSPRTTKVVETQTGIETVSNASAVAANVSGVAEKLNEALTHLRKFHVADPLRGELETAVRRAIDSLSDAGANGLTLSSGLRLSVDSEKLASSLTGLLGGQTRLDTALDTLLDRFTTEAAAFAVPPPEDPSREFARIANKAKEQLVGGHVPIALLLDSSWRAKIPEATALKKATDAYAERKDTPAWKPAERRPMSAR